MTESDIAARAPLDLPVPVGPASPAGRGFLGHPGGLPYLFGTEMWERFSYYGMRAILVYYMVKHLFLPGGAAHVLFYGPVKAALEWVFGPLGTQPLASQIYALYTMIVYLTPLFGGFLADRVLGQRRTVILGTILAAAGHFMMASEPLFFPALLLIALGVGAFKPNTTAQVGRLYAPGDARRDRGYGIFYVGINLGAFLAPLVCGTLGQDVGWHWGFAAAGIGMLCAGAIYAAGLHQMPPDERRQVGADSAASKLARDDWGRIGGILLLCFLNLFFWAVWEQQGNTIALWADSDMDRVIAVGGTRLFEFPSSWVQAVNPAFIFLFTPGIVALWARQARRGREPSSTAKIAIGLGFAGLSYLIMAAATALTAPGEKASVFWFLAYMAVLTTGELYLSPVGLSLVSKAAPRRILSLMTGVWFLANSGGGYLAGWLGTYWQAMPHSTYFLMIAAIGFAAAAGAAAAHRVLRRVIVEEAG